METGAIRRIEDRPGEAVLHVAFELDDLRWTLTMGTGMGRRPRQRRVRPRDREAVLREIEETKRRFGVAGGRTVSCYEAGREGFWLHRWLISEGIDGKAKNDKIGSRKKGCAENCVNGHGVGFEI